MLLTKGQSISLSVCTYHKKEDAKRYVLSLNLWDIPVHSPKDILWRFLIFARQFAEGKINKKLDRVSRFIIPLCVFFT